MKNVRKCLFLSVILMLIQSFAYRDTSYNSMSYFLISRFNVGRHVISSGDIILLAMDMFPVIVYEIVFSVYLYRRFCTASVYYFSRQDNRVRWYGTECGKLLGYTMMFFISYGVLHSMMGIVFGNLKVDIEGVHTFLWCVVLQTLYTFIFVFWMNLLAILFGGQNAMIVVMGIQYLFIFLLQMAENEKEITDVYSWKLYLNPIANVVAAWHSDIADGNMLETTFLSGYSAVYYIVILMISVIAGGIAVRRMDIALENKEEQS